MDVETVARLQGAWENVERARAQLGSARDALRAELERATGAGASQADIARAIGVSRQAVSKRLRGG
jgi:hypothetical protein